MPGGSLQVAVKKVIITGASSTAEQQFLKEVNIALLAAASCQRACRMLGCCKLEGGLCLVMSLYSSSAAKRLEMLQGESYEVLDRLESLRSVFFLIATWKSRICHAYCPMQHLQCGYQLALGVHHTCYAYNKTMHDRYVVSVSISLVCRAPGNLRVDEHGCGDPGGAGPAACHEHLAPGPEACQRSAR